MTSTRPSARGVVAAAAVAALVALAVIRIDTPATSTPSRPSMPGTASAGPASSEPSASAPATAAAPVLTPPATPRIAYHEAPVSAAARRNIRFRDVTAQAGLDVPAAAYRTTTYLQAMTSGIAAARLHGRLAVLLTAPTGSPELFIGDHGHFADITQHAGLAALGPVTAAAFGDLDGDGDEDLVVGRDLTGGIEIHLNRGDDTFGPSASAGIPVRPAAAYSHTAIRGIALGDVNGDGRLDIVTADYQTWVGGTTRPGSSPDQGVCIQAAHSVGRKGSPQGLSALYLGDGHGGFTDRTRAWGLDLDGVKAFTPQLVDLNDDGRLDLVMTSDYCTSRVFLNEDDRRFRPDAVLPRRAMPPYGMGSALTDLNHDGRLDWLATSISYPASVGRCPYVTTHAMGCSGNRFYVSAGGRFVDATDSSGLRETGWGWGVAAEDFANTGAAEVAVTNGYLCDSAGTHAFARPCAYFGHDHSAFLVPDHGRYVEAAAQVGLEDDSVGHALLAFDYDGDGRLDLLINSSDGPHLYRNVTPGSGRHWIDVVLHDPTSPTNPAAWGSRIEIDSAVGVHRCWTTSSTSYETSWAGDCHAGLGAHGQPVTVRVWWPGATHPQVYRQVSVDSVRTLIRK